MVAPRRGRGGALRSASATTYPPPPSPLPGTDQSLGARSIRGDDLSDEEMSAPFRFVGACELAIIMLITLLVLWSLEKFSLILAGSSQDPCEIRVRATLNPYWIVALSFMILSIGVAVFIFLWEVRPRRLAVCAHLRECSRHRSRVQPGPGCCVSVADVREIKEDPLLDTRLSADGASLSREDRRALVISS